MILYDSEEDLRFQQKLLLGILIGGWDRMIIERGE